MTPREFELAVLIRVAQRAGSCDSVTNFCILMESKAPEDVKRPTLSVTKVENFSPGFDNHISFTCDCGAENTLIELKPFFSESSITEKVSYMQSQKAIYKGIIAFHFS